VKPSSTAGLTFTFSPSDMTPKKNARFYATNLLSELDAAGEFFFEIPEDNATR
jgi:hypothetical protein